MANGADGRSFRCKAEVKEDTAMAATVTRGSSLGVHGNGKVAPTSCPMCGQLLLDHGAIERVEHAQEAMERELQIRVDAEAARRAKQIGKRERATAERKMEKLSGELQDSQTALKEQKKAHGAELRKLRTDVRVELATEAEKTAAAKVQRDLRQRDTLINRLKEQNEEQGRRIEHLTADERGEMNEEELVSALHVAFPDDKVERVGRGRAGSDILHEVRYSVDGSMQLAGLIVYECKDTLQWSNGFIAQAKKERTTHGTPHVVIVSRAFPRSEKELCVRDEVPIVAPKRLVELARILREMVITLHRMGLSAEGQTAKTAELYRYLSGEEFRASFGVITDGADDLQEMLKTERNAHERTWAKRQQLYGELGGNAAAIDGRLRAIIERANGRQAKVVRLSRGA